MATYQTLLYTTEGPIGYLTLNRPQALNSVNDIMIDELNDFWQQRRYDQDTRVIILSAAGEKGFSGGLDLKAFVPKAVEYGVRDFYRFQSKLARALLGMRQAPQPIICTVFGAAVGVGMSLALASDLRIISPDARLAASYINVGFGGADMGSSYFLPRLIGAGRAYEFLLTGDFISAETADKLGLVSRVVAREDLHETATEIARTMCRKNPLGLWLTKEAINLNLDCGGFEQALLTEDRQQSMCFATIRYEGQSLDTK